MKRFIAILMTLIMVLGLSSVGVWADDEATWQEETPMSTAKKDLGAVTIGDKIYVVGGYGSTYTVNTLEIYDTTTKTWSTGRPLPEARCKSAVSAIGDKIYVFSGTSLNNYSNSTFIYDATNNTWSSGAPIPTARWNACSVAVGNKIYVMGGKISRSNTQSNKVEIYDTVTDTWTTSTDMPIGRTYFAANVIGNKIYVAFGPHNTNKLDIYDTVTDTWSAGAPVSTNYRSYVSSAVIDEKIYYMGGYPPGGQSTSTVEIYYTDSNTWGSAPSLLTARNAAVATVVNDKIYIMGGYKTDSEYLSSMESLQVGNITPIPEAPSSLTATGGNSVVDLSWGAVSGAESYTVKRSLTEGGPYTVIAEGITDTTYSDTDVVNGTTYYYVVTAISAGGESENSNEASATPQAGSGGEDPTTGKALLVITMTNGLEKEYDLQMSEVNNFIDWYDSKAAGNGQGYYTISKTFNLGPFMTRTDYLTFDKIQNFEVMQYQ